MALQVGDEAPNFELPDQLGDLHELTAYRGGWVLLYFYPKDDTSGCTAEACAIRDNQRDFTLNGLTVLGVSVDPVESHQKFAEKYDLPFTLLSDTDKTVVKLFDVWKPKKMMGKEYVGTHRDSFLIDPDGVVVKIYQGVTPAKHAAEVLADIELLKK